MKMLFKELYLFSPHEELGKMIEFKDGINVITSDKENGTDKGKSVIMRSLYHSLGAEAIFESKWETKSKAYILHFKIDEQGYYIYRFADLYKLFDEDKKLFFVTNKSRELASKLADITHFAVMLPNRNNDKLEVTPPVYNYLPFFLDQDRYNGSKFDSFSNLAQYQNYKDNVLFYHFGVYDETYFELVQNREELEESISSFKSRFEMLEAMLEDIDKKLDVGAYSGDIDSLNKDVNAYRREYSDVVGKLNKSKMNLVKLRNDLDDFETVLKEIVVFGKHNESEIKGLAKHICPECGSEIVDTASLKSKRYNISEDVITVKNDLQASIYTTTNEIEAEENRYTALLNVLNDYEEKLKINTAQVNDILRHKGLCEIRDGIVSERQTVQDSIDDDQAVLDDIKKQIRNYNERKKSIEERYYELLNNAKVKFRLSEIDSDKFKKISTNFSASGSNKYIATVIWYFTIIQIRKEFNPDAIQFPIVLDSPNNVETDNEKERTYFEYLLSNYDLSSQLIISGIGFDTDEFKDYSTQPMNIIALSNDKYKLLSEEDYLQYSPLMEEFCDAEM